MSCSRRLLLGALLLACCATLVLGGIPEEGQRAKLHPFFQQVLADRVARTGAPLRAADHEAIIYTKNPDALRAAGVAVRSVLPEFVTALVSEDNLAGLAAMPEVTFVHPGELCYPLNDASVPETGATLLHAGLIDNLPYKGEGAIVMIYDTGIDWKHKDFRLPDDTTKSRILFIWDQTLTAGAGESTPAVPGLNYGVEYTKAQIENELDGTPAGVVRERDVNDYGHGTHVAGTAAGNGATFGGLYTGMAPLADIIVVKGGDNNFSWSRMIDGLTYANAKATALGKPIAVNFSIGGQSGAHDGTSSIESAITSFASSSAGRVVVVSAGNDGDMAIHKAGSIAVGDSAVITLSVPTYTPNAGTQNDYFYVDAWFADNAAVTATVISPSGVTYTRTAGQSGTSGTTTDGSITLYNTVDGVNGDREVYLRVNDQTASVPKSGTWTLRLVNTSGSTASYDAWLTSSSVGSSEVTLIGGDYDRTTGIPGTSPGAITVGAYVTKWSWCSYLGGSWNYSGADRTNNIASFSAFGPTRDGRQKPDVAAPGQGIASALSSAVDTTGDYDWVIAGRKHWLLQGTSQAAPHVAGTAALILGINAAYSAEDIKALLTATANADAYTGATPNSRWGSGKLDALEAVARSLNPSAAVVCSTYAYDRPAVGDYRYLMGKTKLAMRFTPTISGQVTGVRIQIALPAQRPVSGAGPLKCEIYADSAGKPKAQLGNTVTIPHSQLVAGMFNYVLMMGANVNVTAGTDYHVVLSTTNATDTVLILSDPYTSTRACMYNGTSWSKISYCNYRIRMTVTSGGGVTDVPALAEQVPQEYALLQNYPNPFNPVTNIVYTLGVVSGQSSVAGSHVRLVVYDLLGREVATLVDGLQQAGSYAVNFNAEKLSSGVYFYVLSAGNYAASKKMVVLK